MMWRPKGQRGPKTPQRGSSDEEAQTTTPRRRGRSDSREAAAEADAALEDSEVEGGGTPTGAGADHTPRSASKRRLSLPMLLMKRLSSPPPLGRRRRRPASQGGGEEEGLESEPEQHQQQEGQAESGTSGDVTGDEPADGGGEGVNPAAEAAAAVTTSGEAAAAAPLAAAAAAEGIDAGAGQQEGKLTVAVGQRVEEEDESEEEQPDPEAADALRSVPASPFPAPITPSQLGKARRAATDELRQTLAAHMGAPPPVLATPVRELEVEEHDGGPSSLRSGRSGAASSTVAVAGDGSVASPLSLGETEEQASQVTGTGTSPLSPASSARRPAHALRGRAGQDGSLLSFPSTGGVGAGTPGRRGIGGGGGGARLLSRESMLQAELYRARKQLEEERAKVYTWSVACLDNRWSVLND